MITESFAESSPETLEDVLRRHTYEDLTFGVYGAWVETVDHYFDGVVADVQEKAELIRFGTTEMPLAAVVKRNFHRHYPGVHAYYLIKVDPSSGKRIKFGTYGLEPIIVGFVDDEGNLRELDGTAGPNSLSSNERYTKEQIHQVVRHAHELEAAGFNLTTEGIV